MTTKNPRKLDDIVREMCGVLGIDDAYEQHRITGLWPQIVGETIARISRVRHCKDGVLYVRVFDASWRQELRFRKSGIIRRMNQALEQQVIRDIVFQ